MVATVWLDHGIIISQNSGAAYEVMDKQINAVARKVAPMIQSRRPAGRPDGYSEANLSGG